MAASHVDAPTIHFEASQTLGGHADIEFAAATDQASLPMLESGNVTFGANVLVHGSGGAIGVYGYWGQWMGLVNHGTIRADLQGTELHIGEGSLGGYYSRIESIDNHGIIEAANGATLATHGPLLNNRGVLRTQGARSSIQASTVQSNSGLIEAGANTTIRVLGDFSNAAGGRLRMEWAGDSPGWQGRMVVDGTANLAGALHTFATNGYLPTVGMAFVPLTFGARTGTFDTLLDDVTGSSNRYQAAYGTSRLTLTVIA